MALETRRVRYLRDQTRRFVGRGAAVRNFVHPRTNVLGYVLEQWYSERLYRDYCNDSISRRAASNLFNDMICGPRCATRIPMRQRRTAFRLSLFNVRFNFLSPVYAFALRERVTDIPQCRETFTERGDPPLVERVARERVRTHTSNDKTRKSNSNRVRIVVISKIRRERDRELESRRNSTDAVASYLIRIPSSEGHRSSVDHLGGSILSHVLQTPTEGPVSYIRLVSSLSDYNSVFRSKPSVLGTCIR